MTGMVASLIAVGLAAASIWPKVLGGYPDDLFWSLGIVGQIGAVGTSVLGVAVLFSLLAWKTRLILRIKRQATGTAWALIDLALGLALAAVALSIASQVVSAFHLLSIPSLPQAFVLQDWINTTWLSRIARLPADAALADHAAGVVLWAILPFTIWLHLRDWWQGG